MKERLFAFLAAWSTSSPWNTLAFSCVVTLFMLVGASHLSMEMSQMSLLPKDDPISLEYERIARNFEAGAEQISLVVEARAGAPLDQLPIIAGEIAQGLNALEKLGYVHHTQWEMPQEFFARHGLMLRSVRDLERLEPQVRDLQLVPFLTALNDDWERTFVGGEDRLTGKNEGSAVEALEGLDGLLKSLYAVLDGTLDPHSAQQAVQTFWLGDRHQWSVDRTMLLVTTQTQANIMDSVFQAVAAVEQVDSMLAPLRAKYAEYRIGMTGMAAIQRDEIEANTRDSSLSTLVAFVLIILLLVVSFRTWAAPALAGGVLVLGILWASGIAGWLVGRLNISTVFFAVYLVGLGIDFCIHYMHGYNEAKAQGQSPEQAVGTALTLNGSSILTGAATTALAFLMLVFTDFDMFREMGLIAGLGVLSCMVAALVVLPPSLYLLDRRRQRLGTFQPPAPQISHLAAVQGWTSLLLRFPKIVLVVLVLLTGWAVVQIPNTTFNSNMMDLEPEGLESVDLQHRLLDAFGQSSENVVFTVPTLDSAWKLQQVFEEERLVGSVLSPASLCPPGSEQEARRPLLQRIRALVQPQRQDSGSPALTEQEALQQVRDLREQLERLEANVIEMSQSAFMNQQNRVVRRADRLTGLDSSGERQSQGRFYGVQQVLDSLAPLEVAAKLHSWGFAQRSAELLYAMANPEPLQWHQVPEQWQRFFRSHDGSRYLMALFPRHDVWENMVSNPFLTMVARHVPQATGMLSLMKVVYERARDEGRKAIGYSLIAITALMLLHFRRAPWVGLLAMSPMVLGMVFLLALYAVLGVPFNLMSVMALPMIIGIGVDDGVHICHRLLKNEDPNKIPSILGHVGMAVFLTTLTTGIAFGSLLFGVMRGNQSLGAVLSLGVGLCYLVSITVIPVLYSTFTRRKK